MTQTHLPQFIFYNTALFIIHIHIHITIFISEVCCKNDVWGIIGKGMYQIINAVVVFCATAIVMRVSLARNTAYIYIWSWMMLRYMFGYKMNMFQMPQFLFIFLLKLNDIHHICMYWKNIAVFLSLSKACCLSFQAFVMFVCLCLTFENSNQIKLLQIASNCIRLIIWLKQDKIGSNWIKLDQT